MGRQGKWWRESKAGGNESENCKDNQRRREGKEEGGRAGWRNDKVRYKGKDG